MDNFRFIILHWGGHRDDGGKNYIGGKNIAAKFRGSTLEELKECVVTKIRVDRTRYDIVLKCWLIVGNSGIVQYILQEDDCVDFFFFSVKEGMPELDVEFVERGDFGFPSYDPYYGPSVAIPTQVPFAPFAQLDGNYPSMFASASSSNQVCDAVPPTGDDIYDDNCGGIDGDDFDDVDVGEVGDHLDASSDDNIHSAGDDISTSESNSNADDDLGIDTPQEWEPFTTAAAGVPSRPVPSRPVPSRPVPSRPVPSHSVPPCPVPQAAFYSGPPTQGGAYGAIPTRWVVPSTDQYSINLPITDASSSNGGPFYNGRPRAARIPSAGEGRRRVKCSRYGGSGHNRANCQNAQWTTPGSATTTSVNQDVPPRRNCSVCRQVGHRRNRCPQINHSQEPSDPGSSAAQI